MTGPLISVLIDTYNQERYIDQAIESVLAQDFPAAETEIFVVDDGSTDNTSEIIQKFVPQVHYIRKRNGGQASAFNACIPELRGRIISFLDGDDWWAPGKLTAVADAFEANPGVAAVGHGFFEVRENERAREMFVAAKTCHLNLRSIEAARLAFAGLTLLGTSRLSVRREVLSRIGPIPLELTFCADSPIQTFALALGGAIVLDQPLCYYRQHSQNLYAPIAMDAAASRRRFEQLGFLLSYVPPRLAEFGISPEVIDALIESPLIEFERAKLQYADARRWNVFCTELRRFRAYYDRPSVGYLVFECFVGVCALLLPPLRFYRLLRWYGRHDLGRFRKILGRAEPRVSPAFFQRRPVVEHEI
ncbi:MAG: glycosyltransferase [Paraburkholderia sp.]|uniref:glycosyltransferase family 2 protein n=1 Tax=Paraburkholderia sp. TaxID=1926495 RepID=UPI003C5C6FEB